MPKSKLCKRIAVLPLKIGGQDCGRDFFKMKLVRYLIGECTEGRIIIVSLIEQYSYMHNNVNTEKLLPHHTARIGEKE